MIHKYWKSTVLRVVGCVSIARIETKLSYLLTFLKHHLHLCSCLMLIRHLTGGRQFHLNRSGDRVRRGVKIRKYTSLCVRDIGNNRSFLHIAACLKWAACCRLVSMCPDMNGVKRTWRSEARRFPSLNSDKKHQLWTVITVFILNTATRPRLLRCKVKNKKK